MVYETIKLRKNVQFQARNRNVRANITLLYLHWLNIVPLCVARMVILHHAVTIYLDHKFLKIKFHLKFTFPNKCIHYNTYLIFIYVYILRYILALQYLKIYRVNDFLMLAEFLFFPFIR